MIRLNLSADPRSVDLLPGLRLKVAPVTTAIMASARADVSLDRLDPDAPKEILAVAMAQAVARRVVSEWEGVGDDDGNPIAVTPEGIDALLNIWPVFEAFQEKILGPYLVLDAEKTAPRPRRMALRRGRPILRRLPRTLPRLPCPAEFTAKP